MVMKVLQDGRQLDFADVAAVREALAAGRLRANDHLWDNLREAWRPLGAVFGDTAVVGAGEPATRTSQLPAMVGVPLPASQEPLRRFVEEATLRDMAGVPSPASQEPWPRASASRATSQGGPDAPVGGSEKTVSGVRRPRVRTVLWSLAAAVGGSMVFIVIWFVGRPQGTSGSTSVENRSESACPPCPVAARSPRHALLYFEDLRETMAGVFETADEACKRGLEAYGAGKFFLAELDQVECPRLLPDWNCLRGRRYYDGRYSLSLGPQFICDAATATGPFPGPFERSFNVAYSDDPCRGVPAEPVRPAAVADASSDQPSHDNCPCPQPLRSRYAAVYLGQAEKTHHLADGVAIGVYRSADQACQDGYAFSAQNAQLLRIVEIPPAACLPYLRRSPEISPGSLLMMDEQRRFLKFTSVIGAWADRAVAEQRGTPGHVTSIRVEADVCD